MAAAPPMKNLSVFWGGDRFAYPDVWPGTNITLGLPFPRTSPDHGTAYSIAGTGRANAGSFLVALDLAARLATRHR